MCISGNTTTLLSVELPPGTYIITAHATFNILNADGRVNLRINSGNEIYALQQQYIESSTFQTILNASCVLSTTKNITVNIGATQNTGNSQNIQCNYFAATRVSQQ